MKRAILTAVCVLLAPAMALAAGFTADLTGDAGTGVAVITISDNTISYNILVSGLDPMPTNASLVGDFTTIDLEASFMNGSAIGSVTSDLAGEVADNPTAWDVEVSNGSATLSGTLQGMAAGDNEYTVVFPVAANVTGLAGTNFVTDARMLNQGDDTATVNIDYYVAGADGNTAPTASATVTIAAGEQLVVNDIVGGTFNQADTKGAVVATSDMPMLGAMRIYNDQSDAGEGTFGQYVKGLGMDYAMTTGSVLFLSNEEANTGMGYRSNIGWFNPNGDAVELTLMAYDADGTMLGEKTFSVAAMAQEQFAISSAKLWPELEGYGDFYLMYSVSGDHGIFVYGSVVDNVNGDAIYVAAE